MQFIRCFGDTRILAGCCYCGAPTESRDHVPPKAFLDEPFPENLPVVPACFRCNNQASSDEEYTAALIDCVCVGSALPRRQTRQRTRRKLEQKLSLATRIGRSRRISDDAVEFVVEAGSVNRVLLKIARGLIAYELHETVSGQPWHFAASPLAGLSSTERKHFFAEPEMSIVPELGSRAMQRAFVDADRRTRWIEVQPGRFRYLAHAAHGVAIRFVLAEYLACEAAWT